MPRLRPIHALPLAGLAFACAAPARQPAPVHLALASAEAPLAPPAAAPVATSPRASASQPRRSLGETHVNLGLHTFGSDDLWDPVDEVLCLSVDTSFENVDDLVGIEWGFALAADDGNRSGAGVIPGSTEADDRLNVDLEYYEGSLGVHRTFLRQSSFRPYLGAGLAAIYYEAEAKYYDVPGGPRVRKEHKRLTFGLYLHGGAALQLGENFMVGLDLRAMFGTEDTNLFEDGNLDYQRASLFVGFGG